MAIGETAYVNGIRGQLLAGRARLNDVLAGGEKEHVELLLNQVDEALERLENGTFGICEECHTEIGEDWLRENPLTTVCIEHMTAKQRSLLEYDLEVAAQIQKGLLPPCDQAFQDWNFCYHYRPAGAVSGDYCDVIRGGHGELYFIIADVSGKGVAAAMLASNLRAVLRSLIPLALPVTELMARANRLFRESALPTQYATVVCGRATAEGEMEVVNAGHLPALLTAGAEMRSLESENPPLGLFDDQKFVGTKATLRPGETMVLYTDGISEAENDGGEEYGIDRLRQLMERYGAARPDDLVNACKEGLAKFRGARERADDETLLVLQYAPGTGRIAAA